MVGYKIILIASYLTIIMCAQRGLEDEEAKGRAYLHYFANREIARYKKGIEADWLYETNITEHNLKHKIAVATKNANEAKKDWLKTRKFNWMAFRNPDLRRQFKKLTFLGANVLSTKKYVNYTETIANMEKIYYSIKLCGFHNASKCDLQLEPDILNIISRSRNPEELKHMWIGWRNAIGPKVKDMYETYVSLSNEVARLNNYTDHGAVWRDDFESSNIKEEFDKLWEQIKPLYQQLHAYVRYKLREKYGNIVPEHGPIPGHLLGNMFAHTWTNIVEFTLPYPNIAHSIVTEEMVKQGYTPVKMFQLANDFFLSLNLKGVPPSFWNKSLLEKPPDGREVICHASSMDFYDNDVRTKLCALVTEEDLYVVHHEMGHIQYFLQYSSQPGVYREGANSGFHEAVGDVISLSVSTPKHLHNIGLSDKPTINAEVLINTLYKHGLDKIVSLPSSYINDLWRWDVFAGKISKDKWNCKWWELKIDRQGIKPPVDRSDDDFDPAAKFHIIADMPFIGYFVSNIIQFQFHRSLCLKAGDYIPDDPDKLLSNCDIYKNTKAGEALGRMLKMGCSKPWPDAMQALTGQRNMDAGALLEYFRPLHDWLEKENKRNGVHIGWKSSQRVCSGSKNQGKKRKKLKRIGKKRKNRKVL